MLLADAPPGGPGGEASPLRACHKVCASDCDRRWCLWALQIRLFFGLQTHQRRSDLRLWSILRPFYPFSCAVASRQLMGGSSETAKVQPADVRLLTTNEGHGAYENTL